jgi:D-alanyl-D-alanine carboxypeptidase/D-alanyl-D-alanine-endopeptidase (penicillin-binding protein 4)
LRCSYPSMRSFPLLLCLFAALMLAPAQSAAGSQASVLKRTLSRYMSGAGASSGAYVMDADSDRTLFSWRAGTPRSLASNTKLFTSAAVLGRYGPNASLATTLLGDGTLSPSGAWKGSIYLRGGGDPTFGSRAFARSAYGSNADVEELADALDAAGFRSVSGSVVGDESSFDSLRGGPDSNYATDIWVGPLSAIGFDRGLANSHGTAFQKNPPQFAAAKLNAALEKRGIKVKGKPRAGTAPDGAVALAEARSPVVARLLTIQNKDSDNYFAEMLSKGLAMAPSPGGSLRRAGAPMPVTPTPDAPAADPAQTPGTIGTTRSGAASATAYARSLGSAVNLVDGSGLSRSDRAAPREVAQLLDGLRDEPGFKSLYASLPIAGRDGTLADRMRTGRARGRCHAKTGTLTGVSALSGYCTTRSGRTLVFSVLMNNANVYTARTVQDRVANALAGYRG